MMAACVEVGLSCADGPCGILRCIHEYFHENISACNRSLAGILADRKKQASNQMNECIQNVRMGTSR